ncbi:MAG: rhodanese-like domain-containing protein [Flavobacteriales bacterium]|nr:rhodanese-like domain-containing protein [Flavobacteriia bacterium]NCP06148.1 rhodanese-like domain-containing protein [Flavobacteriales bacterium]PIV93750.1 MAG: rhodanese-like domain-containing protein [Flavobacteriaceae bacterium CG17_big_fil_post_rev_8_21_14_2_50_33_15]PIY11196.1 MAG: rhodanese-like domain-containing protein [Flavobacteriaceae bacterium CG_4_10_14_3_um_filter_33_47]PJB17456.1 MAG: rhodanese-like domain-containing protein [Flavobacteriaceae bacterium CG_4_9_14_3_um_filter
MKHLLVLLSIVLSCFVFNCKGQSDDKINNISVEEMQLLLKSKDIQLVDVRTPQEFKAGFIGDAVNIDYYSPTFEEEIRKLDKKKPIILYCKSGRRSSNGSEKLEAIGFVKVYNLLGGIDQWKQKGLKVNKK